MRGIKLSIIYIVESAIAQEQTERMKPTVKVIIVVHFVQLLEVHLVPQETANAA